MKIIDLINMRAEGKEMPKKIRIDHWCYTFEWIEHESNYYDKIAEIDLMSCLSMDKEELNYEVEIIDNEDEDIEEMTMCTSGIMGFEAVEHITTELKDKLNNLVREVNKLKKNRLS